MFRARILYTRMGAVKENQQAVDATEAGDMVDRFRARRNEPDCQAGLISDRGQDPIGQSRQGQIGLGASITTFERPAHADDVDAIFGVPRVSSCPNCTSIHERLARRRSFEAVPRGAQLQTASLGG